MHKEYVNFSVIIPTHNRDGYLAIALNSVIGQSYLPHQIIVVDDVPNVDTERLVKKMSLNSEMEILYIKNLEKQGALRSRNIGIKHASGNYLAFLDDDDYWGKDYLKYAAEGIENENAEVVIAKVVKFNDKNQFKDGKIPPDVFRIEDYYLENPGILCSNFIVAKDKYSRVGGYDESVWGSADKDLFMQLKKIGCKHYIIKDRLVFWRCQHQDQWSDDYGRVLPSVLRFYKKYYKEMNIIYRLKMIKKIINFFIKSKLSNRKKAAETAQINNTAEQTMPKLLYIGCGHDRMEGFIHVEINLGKNKSGMPDIVADISDYIPFPDNSVDLIFSRDTMEHLTYAEFVNCLIECHRILKKGGCVRMVVPNFDIMIKQYFDKVHDLNMRSPGMPNENYADTFIGRILYFDHRYLHNFNTLSRALKKAGFEQARECLPGDSKIECTRPQLLKAETNLPREIIVEAMKLDRKPQVEKQPKIYPRNPIAKFFAKYLNIKITAFTERKARFPHRYWLKTLIMFNKNKKFK